MSIAFLTISTCTTAQSSVQYLNVSYIQELVDLYVALLKVEYHSNAKYENQYQNSEKIACIGQRLMYPIMEKKNNTSPC